MNFFQRNKKVFLIILFLAFVTLIAYFLWTIFFKSEEQIIEPGTEEPGLIDGLPISPTGTPNIVDGGQDGDEVDDDSFPNIGPNITERDTTDFIAGGSVTKVEQVDSSKTMSLTATTNGSVQYYNENDNYFYRINSNGELERMSDQQFYNVDDVTWSSVGDKAVIEYPDGRKIMYNFETEKQVTLQSHWHDFSFSPSGDSLVSKSIGLEPENRFLITSNDDGSNARALKQLERMPIWFTTPGHQIIK